MCVDLRSVSMARIIDLAIERLEAEASVPLRHLLVVAVARVASPHRRRLDGML